MAKEAKKDPRGINRRTEVESFVPIADNAVQNR